MKNKYYPIIVFILVVALLFSACSTKNSAANDDSETDKHDSVSESQNIEILSTKITTLTQRGSLLLNVLSANYRGAYALYQNPSGSADFIFYDCDNRTVEYFGGERGSKAGFVELTAGGISPLIAGDKLYSFKFGTRPDELVPSGTKTIVTQRDLDGENLRSIEFPLNREIQIDNNVAFDGYSLYFIVANYKENTGEFLGQSLCRTDFDKEEIVDILQFDSDGVYSFIGTCSEGLVFDKTTIPPKFASSNVLEQLNNMDHQITVFSIADNTFKDCFFYNNQDGIGTICNNRWIFLAVGDPTLYFVDLQNGEVIKSLDIAQESISYDYIVLNQPVWDNHLIVSYCTNDALDAIYYSLDLSSFTLKPLEMYYSSNENKVLLGITAETEKYFIVETGELSYSEHYTGYDGKNYIATRLESEYSMILKEDYWNSKADGLISFTDDVHK